MSSSLHAIRNLADAARAELIAGLPDHPGIAHLVTDSRKLVAPDPSLFFAIKGDRRDGHDFLAELYEAGVRNFVITRREAILPGVAANYLVVKDTQQALQDITAWHRSKFTFPVFAITGSNGKTIVKEWLYQLLREHYHIVRSPKSYNSQIGVPLSVWQISSENDLGIFEAGISQPGEMAALEKIIRPTTGIFTNIGAAHDENFAGTVEKIREKMELFRHVEHLIYCKDYPAIHDAVINGEILPASVSLFTWSRKAKADLQVGRINKKEHETEVQAIYKNEFIQVRIPFTDDASIENAIHCWACLLHLGIDTGEISTRMELLSPVAMRLEMKDGINNCSVINDSYNSDIGSLTIALDFMNQQKQHRRRTVILSDILQSGKEEEQLYQQVAALLHQKGISRMIGIGPALLRQEALFQSEKQFYKDTDEFLRDLNYSNFSNETILIKGARAFGFERISRALQQKAHETVLEINLNAVIQNLNLFKSRLRPETKLMVMVKAFSYGSGSFEIANVLQFHRADYLAVAYADEGVDLRKTGITLPIMVMNPEEQSFDAMISYKLEPEIYSFRVLNHFTESLRRRGLDASSGRFPVHLELDTGMKRLGFDEDEVNELIVRLKNNKYIRLASVFTHLVASDEIEHDVFTREQIARFDKMSKTITSHFNYPVLRHVLNSSGILRFPEAQMDMVRLGIGLHGIASTPNEQRQLQMVATLKTTISQIRQVKAGETVGYSRKGRLEKDTLLATVGIGYADGLSRRLGNGNGFMLVDGHKAPIVGSVCMDMTMIDITGIPSAREGTEVIVFGQSPSILDIAQATGTIPYEVLTGISGRVKRIYFHE